MKKRATLKDIANALNVSITTVSRALNNKEDISDETKNAVLQVAQILDYKPNALAVSLRKNTANKLIGVILPFVDHYFYSTILNGIMTASKEGDNLIIIGESNHSAEKEAEIIDMFADYFVSGIVIVPSKNIASRKNLRRIGQKEIPVVLMDRTLKDYRGSSVQYDDYRGGYIATEHLLSQGRKRIAHIRGDEHCSVSSERFKGYQDALGSNDIQLHASLVRKSIDSNEKEGYDLMKDILEQNDNPPDGLFAVTDNVAAGAYEAIYEHQLKIPEDIAVVGYSNSLLSSHLSPKLTTVEQNGRTMGKTAYSILADTIENPSRVIQKTYGAHLLIRGSSIRSTSKT